MPDHGFSNVLPATMSAGHDVSPSQTNLPRAKGNVLLTEASNLRSTSSS
tara:strand:+ start:27834 stop:27980 length:147 start_codon:yes stop_codon:yes gene_type:complete